MSLFFTLLPALVIAQAPAPFERSAVDPLLPDALRPIVEQAIDAELDPKRGPGNAISVFTEAMRAHAANDKYMLALRLRMAGVVLRKRFVEDRKFPESLRYEQVISTFSRLDLREPGLREWLDAAIAHHPPGKKRLDEAKRTLPVAILVRGTGLDRKLIGKSLIKAFKDLGLKIRIVPPKRARFVLKFATENPKTPVPGRHAVRVILGIEAIAGGKVVWNHTLFRTQADTEAQAAIDTGVDGLMRIGGRDMLFLWLGKVAFPSLVARPKNQGAPGSHEGHGH